jgi:broad specificity phosphatase PhoE/predicted kinase
MRPAPEWSGGAVEGSGGSLVLVMVGLPARGKTFIARKVERYLRWLGHPCRLFNVGNYRRDRHGAKQAHGFFDSANADAAAARRELAEHALRDLLEWVQDRGRVGIYDATNNTRERRAWVAARCAEAGVDVLFIESVCNDPEIIESNIRETKARSPDYVGVDEESAVRDFRARIAHYEATYQPVDEDGLSWIKLVDVGRRVVANRVTGYLPTRLVFFLMNLHISSRTIYLSRHGESAYNLDQRIGGDPPLSPRGLAYAARLGATMRGLVGPRPEVWASPLQRALITALEVTPAPRRLRALVEIDAGACEGMTYAEIADRMPDEFQARRVDKLRYRYPQGESYEDVIQRLEPVILDLERTRRSVLVVSHQAVLRALLAYFLDEPLERCPYLEVPLHTLIELVPKAYGTDQRWIPLPEPPITA